ncbi:MAG TPA: hypothetical protein ENL09_02385 [Bacteroidetes bacterium]|nr:hypothetical protein [Bacteroidota bacterium]
MPAKKNKRKKYLKADILIKMAHALVVIKKDLEESEGRVLNKEEVIGEIIEDLLRVACDYKFVEK